MEFLTRIDLGDRLEESLENKLSDLLDNKLPRNEYVVSYLDGSTRYPKISIVKATCSDNAKRFVQAVHGSGTKILEVKYSKLFY